MYYEIEGTGEPLVYIPAAFGYAGVNEFPTLRRNRQVITMDLQGHGRTADIPERPITFDQRAKDVIGLLEVFSLQCPGFSKEELASIQAPFLIIQGDNDFVRIEHSVETYKTIPNAELAIIPDTGHFVLNWDPQKVIPTIETFLSEPSVKIPFATPETGYHPGETR
jgi:pimeloyl-ACP methyl ester carboxylesterase